MGIDHEEVLYTGLDYVKDRYTHLNSTDSFCHPLSYPFSSYIHPLTPDTRRHLPSYHSQQTTSLSSQSDQPNIL